MIGLVHIGLLKEYVPRNPEPTVKRVTTVLESDTESDSMDQQFTELIIRGTAQSDSREQDIKEWEEEFGETLTKEPGLTQLAEFKMDMGDHTPIAQHSFDLEI